MQNKISPIHVIGSCFLAKWSHVASVWKHVALIISDLEHFALKTEIASTNILPYLCIRNYIYLEIEKLLKEMYMSDIIIKPLEKKDFNLARKFAIDGMHLSRYATTKIELYFYSKYFWYSEISKATKAFAAYMNGTLVGVLLANMKNEPKVFKSWWYKLWVKF